MGDTDWGGIDDKDDESDEEKAYDALSGGRDSIMFLIDCSKFMFKATSDEETSFKLSIKCAINVMKKKIISSERDLIGIIFFGTKESTNLNFKHIYVCQELEQPGVDSILKLNKFLKDDVNFEKNYGWCDDYSLADALWTCSDVFSKCTFRLANRRVMLFTNEDHPHDNNRQMQSLAVQRARDLYDSGIEIVLMPILKQGAKSFDHMKFYKDIVMLPDDELDGRPFHVSDKYEEILSRVRTKDHKKRSTGRVNLTLPGNLNIGVSIFNLVRTLSKPTSIRLAKDTNVELSSMTKTFLEETGEILLPADLKRFQEYGGKKLHFEKDEILEIRRIFEPGIVLLGFKPASELKTYHHVKPASFLYPDNSRIDGSTLLFNALLQKCLERNMIAICRYTPRTTSVTDLVALVPQNEEVGDDNVQITPPGFHIVHLPYAEDFRMLNMEKIEEASTEHIDKAKAIIRKLKCPFRSDRFENPVLQLHWRNIEALALDLDEADEFVDYTLPETEMIEERAGKLIEEFKEMVFPEASDHTASKKREAPDEKTTKKKIKQEVDFQEIKSASKAGKLQKLTVDVLKKYCQSLGYKTTGKKKAELIEDIESHFADK